MHICFYRELGGKINTLGCLYANYKASVSRKVAVDAQTAAWLCPLVNYMPICIAKFVNLTKNALTVNSHF